MTPAESTIKRWREDERGILQYADEQFQFQPDPWQERALLHRARPDRDRRRPQSADRLRLEWETPAGPMRLGRL